MSIFSLVLRSHLEISSIIISRKSAVRDSHWLYLCGSSFSPFLMILSQAEIGHFASPSKTFGNVVYSWDFDEVSVSVTAIFLECNKKISRSPFRWVSHYTKMLLLLSAILDIRAFCGPISYFSKLYVTEFCHWVQAFHHRLKWFISI